MSLFRLLRNALFLSFLLLGLTCDVASAKVKIKKTDPAEDHRILVTSVNIAQQQITVIFKETGQTETYTVNDATQVTVDNNPGTLKDIKAGQEVFTYVEGGGQTLDSVAVGVAQPASATAFP